MKIFYTAIFSFILYGNAFGHSDSNLSYQYGQVLISIKTGIYNRVQEDIKLLGQLLDKVCKNLNISDTVHIDFIHDYSCIDCKSYYMFSKTEPFIYNLFYLGDENFSLGRDRYSDSLNGSNIESTIRIIGSSLDLREALKVSTLLLYHQNKIESTEFKDLFSRSKNNVYKSTFQFYHSRFYKYKENKMLFQLIDNILAEKNWLYYPDEDVNFIYYYQDSTYYIVHKKDSSLIDTAKKIYCLGQATNNPFSMNLFVFKNPFEFSVTNFSYYHASTETIYIHSKINLHICNILESDLNLNGRWNISWLFGGVYLLDHSNMMYRNDGPFVLYDEVKKDIILTQKE